MGNRLYVGNLSYDLSTEDLRAAFQNVGQVTDAKVLVDRESGRSRGFGFVTMASDAEAQKAIREMDGFVLGGRSLRVNEAEDRRPSQGGGGGGGGGGSYHASGNGGGYSGGGGPRGGGGGRTKEPRRGRRDDRDSYG